MGGRFPPLTCKDFKTALGNLGFSPRPRKATSHEQWVRYDESGRLWKVTVDCPKAPFSGSVLASMIHQSGFSKKQVYAAAGK